MNKIVKILALGLYYTSLCLTNPLISKEKSTMKILCITHADFETPGVIEKWAYDKGHAFTISRPYKGNNCLLTNDFDFLIVMGGPQSACTLDDYPYLKNEVVLIQHAIKENKWVLGFCLGAQLIGEALGARAERSPEKEIGVFPITLTDEGQLDRIFKDFPTTFPVIHWHNDMPGITQTSLILAYSAGCPRQIVKYTDRVYGLQCHLEIMHEGIALMTESCPEDFNPSLYTQTPQELLEHNYEAINDSMRLILDRLTTPE